MKLYLSSLRIPDKDRFLGLFEGRADLTAAVITNAWDVAPSHKSEPYIAATENELQKLRIKTIRFDLRKYEGKPRELQQALGAFATIWVMGGNTFYLRWQMRQSGFDQIISELLKNGLVYGGESAGAVVAGTTLHGIELLDDSAEAPETEIIWEGLGLVSFGVLPHWGGREFQEWLQKSKTEMGHFDHVTTLTDSQYIVVDDNNTAVKP